MRQWLVRFAGVVMVHGLLSSTASGQVFNQPIYVSPKHGTGLSIAFDYGKGLNDNSGKFSAVGGRATLGLGLLTVSAGASSVSLTSTSEMSFGANASLNIISAPLVPVGISVFAGFGTISVGGNSSKSYPIGAAIAVKPPTPGLGIEFWAAPRLHIQNTGSGTSTDFAISGGVNLDFPMGLGIHAALDYIAASDAAGNSVAPMLLGAGVHYKFTIPGLGL